MSASAINFANVKQANVEVEAPPSANGETETKISGLAPKGINISMVTASEAKNGHPS